MGRRYGWRGWVDFAGVEVLVGAGEHVDVAVVKVVGQMAEVRWGRVGGMTMMEPMRRTA
jgi:hypothetical protein